MPRLTVKVLGKTFMRTDVATAPHVCVETALPTLVLIDKFPRLFTDKMKT